MSTFSLENVYKYYQANLTLATPKTNKLTKTYNAD